MTGRWWPFGERMASKAAEPPVWTVSADPPGPRPGAAPELRAGAARLRAAAARAEDREVASMLTRKAAQLDAKAARR